MTDMAIRGLATCEVHIPAVRFDPFALIELIGRYGALNGRKKRSP